MRRRRQRRSDRGEDLVENGRHLRWKRGARRGDLLRIEDRLRARALRDRVRELRRQVERGDLVLDLEGQLVGEYRAEARDGDGSGDIARELDLARCANELLARGRGL